jgi:serine/threonine protein kinase
VYRDIKQANIGFDVRGDVKVFDFGLAKGLSESLRAKSTDGHPLYGYNLTARSGKQRFMFVAGRPYTILVYQRRLAPPL